MPNNIRIFVGSSTEAADIDRDVRSILEDLQVEVIGWKEAFRAGDHPLDVLLAIANSADGALLIATPDDKTVLRGQQCMTPRGNILLELGIFLSQLGRYRAAVVHAISESTPQLPSDLLGVTNIQFVPGKRGHNEQQLKLFVDRVRQETEAIHPAISELQSSMRLALSRIPSTWHKELDFYVLQTIREAIHLATRGQILLSPAQYYAAIYTKMDSAAKDTNISAVATLSSAFWSEDRDQQNYLGKNRDAVQRGARIRRLFVVPDTQWNDLTHILSAQIAAGIKVRRAVQRIATHSLTLEDMVIFSNTREGTSHIFVADPDFDNNRKIRRARIILDEHERRNLIALFEQAWAAAPDVTLKTLDPLKERDKADVEPAQGMKRFGLAEPVVSCEEAAAAKCIPLENELKTLILTTSKGFCALNLPGDSAANFRAVKAALDVEQACLASHDELAAFGLTPGAVCAIKRPVWDMPFLISRRLLRLQFVSTNDGTLRGFYKFSPALLLEASSVLLGDFEKLKE